MAQLPFGGELSWCYGLHVVCCDDLGLSEWELEDHAIALIRCIRAMHALACYVG